MKKIMYLIWDMFLSLLFMILNVLGCFFLGLLPLLIGLYTPWNWVSLLTFISGPFALVLMLELTDKIDDWFDERQSIGKEIERGI